LLVDDDVVVYPSGLTDEKWALLEPNVAGMLRNHSLARHLSDAAFGQLRRQLTYKTSWYSVELVVADRWFPSSKTCSSCANVDAELTLADRIYRCSACGLALDRDVNAAMNLARLALVETSPPRSVAA
jgi:putative transposase